MGNSHALFTTGKTAVESNASFAITLFWTITLKTCSCFFLRFFLRWFRRSVLYNITKSRSKCYMSCEANELNFYILLPSNQSLTIPVSDTFLLLHYQNDALYAINSFIVILMTYTSTLVDFPCGRLRHGGSRLSSSRQAAWSPDDDEDDDFPVESSSSARIIPISTEARTGCFRFLSWGWATSMTEHCLYNENV